MKRRVPVLLLCVPLCCLVLYPALTARGQVQVVPAPAEARQKLAETTRALSEALAALAKAEATAADAAKEVEAARKKADELRAEVAKLNRQALDAATARALAARGLRGSAATAERENADPQDPNERFALLTPGGPIVVHVSLTIGGQPFRSVREKLIDELLVAADKDKDGQATWDEALTSPRFTLGRVRIANDQQKQAYQKSLDKNADGLVDRPEARLFVAQYFGAPAFLLSGGAGGNGGAVFVANGRMISTGGGQADVRALLDLDADGMLSEKEIAAAGERLKTRDADDNDLLYAEEISGIMPVQGRVTNLAGQQQQTAQLTVLLGPVATADGLFMALSQRYKNAEGDIVATSFPGVPALFEALDRDQSGKLQKEELLALNDVPPHVEMSVDLGAREAKGLTLKSVAAELTKNSETPEAAVLELPGVRLSLTANRAAPQTANYEQVGKTYLMQFDKDSNGYLEKSELPENVAQQVESWDENEDGKIYPEEITASYARQLAPQASQVAANVASQGNSLFQALDQTGDGRLSLREMRVAAAQILALDKDLDQQISLREIPATISVTFGLGNTGYGYQVVSRPGAMPGAGRPAAASDGPEWFTRMDRNGDGDVTLKEFLGDETEFKQLDTSGDGFIEAKEAAAIEAAK